MSRATVTSLVDAAERYEPTQSRRCISCIPIAEFIQRERPDHSIKGLIPRRGLGMLYGETGCGKTAAGLDVGMHIAEGHSWRGLRVKQGGVIYISAEGASGLPNRIQAYLTHYGVDPSDVLLEIIPANVNLLNPGEQLDELIDAIDDAARRIGGISLIIIDTLNRTMQGGDENSSADMGAFLNNVSFLADEIDAFALIIRHSGKEASRGARGHSSLKAAVDVELEVTKGSDGDRVITVTKSRDGEDGMQFGFRLEPVELGEDEDGDPITSCVVIPTEVVNHRKRKLSGVARTALTALQEAIRNHGRVMRVSAPVEF